MNRRNWLVASAAVTGSALIMRTQQRKYSRDLRPKRSRVAILHTDEYSDKLDELVYDGLRLFNLDVRGKSVLLKPNIVEYIPGKPVNTDTQLIGAAAEGFLRLGAGSVTVGEGPGHQRDTELLVYETAVRYHFIHALGLLAIGVLLRSLDGGLLRWSATLVLAGIILFSGSLYWLTFGAPRFVGIITPLGGLALIAGWILFATTMWRQ